MDSRKGHEHGTILHHHRSHSVDRIVCSGGLVLLEYFFISSLMEQIDLLNDRFLRLLNDNPQSQTMEHIRSAGAVISASSGGCNNNNKATVKGYDNGSEILHHL